jgi:hypothetical protein
MKKEPDWNKVMEETWGRALVHESGHALVAALEGIHCEGIYYDKGAHKFCALIAPLPPPDQMNKGHYRFLLASSAAEDAIYGDHDEAGATSDRSFFQNPGAPPLEDTLDEVRTTVNGKKRQIRQIVFVLRSSLPALENTHVKLLLASAELDPGVDGKMSLFNQALHDELCKLDGPKATDGKGHCPVMLFEKGESHMSEVFSIDTPDKTVSAPILAWMERIK